MRANLWRWVVVSFALQVMLCPATGQTRRSSAAVPQIDVVHYVLRAALKVDEHEFDASATLQFKPLEPTDVMLFQISENLSVQKVLNEHDEEIEFAQDETGPGTLTVRFPRALPADELASIQVQYTGGFDRDRYSRLFSRDEASAYIGMEGTYLLYSAKWFPLNQFLVDRATAEIHVTVPLGFTVVGPGDQLPVITTGITEEFGWSSKIPILPNSVVAGRYFERAVQAGDMVISCFAREEHLESIEKSAQALAKILSYYTNTFGPSASGRKFRLVEVNDALETQPGTLGSIYVTQRELAQPAPPVRNLARRAAYQWWKDTVGIRSVEDVWLIEGLSYYATALYLESVEGSSAFEEEINNLAVLGLKFENKSAVRVGMDLGYRTEAYESVVAGKGAWVLHMLRNLTGRQKFVELLSNYRREFAGKGASSAEFQKLAETAYGQELGWFFSEWIDTIGIPELQTEYVVFKTQDGFKVSGSIKQDRDLFRMPLEVEVITADKSVSAVVELNGKSTPYEVSTFALPSRVVLDPANKILRDSPELQISVQLSLGADMKSKGEFVEAIRAYESALKINPRKSLAHYRLAEVFYEQFNLQAAANSFRDSLNGDKDPPWVEVWCYIYLGKIYDILGQRQRAMAEYNKAINTKDDTYGSQEEAKKWLAKPFTRERTVMESVPKSR